MREVVLDTETTGLDPETGDRIVEIGAIELVNHLPSGNIYHQYINPERAMPDDAFQVHGLGDDFLRDKPHFKDIGTAFLDFIGTAPLVIHNATFDIKFLNAELGWAHLPLIGQDRAVDTLALARRKYPGSPASPASPASLDALCRRFGIDSSARHLHGALVDSEILAEVYLELIGGRQPGFGLDGAHRRDGDRDPRAKWRPGPRPQPLPARLTEVDRAAHAKFVRSLGAGAIWSKFQSG